MRFLLCFLLLAAFASCKPAMSRDERFREFWGESINVTAAELIIGEEAKKLGIKEEDHMEQCLKIREFFLSQMHLTPEEKNLTKTEEDTLKADSVWFNSTDEVMPYISRNYPTYYAVHSKKIKAFEMQMVELDEQSKEFIRNAGHLILAEIVKQSQQLWLSAEQPMKTMLSIDDKWGKSLWREIDFMVWDLPKDSQNNLEKVFCTQPALKIPNYKGETKEVEEAFIWTENTRQPEYEYEDSLLE